MRILSIFGTRPEAIKLAPVIQAVGAAREVTQAICVTGQHGEILDEVLQLFGLRPDYDLAVLRAGQSLTDLAATALAGAGRAIIDFKPDWVLVQGDTTSALAGALAAFYQKVPVAHVEAGLRTGTLDAPWPEEANRRLIAQLAAVHFAPTPLAAENLKREGIAAEAILVTGNTVIDALNSIAGQIDAMPALAAHGPVLDARRRLILVTGHRRENMDGGLEQVCRALVQIAARGDVQVLFAVHPNPAVRQTVDQVLAQTPNIHCIPPQDYRTFVGLMRRAHFIITDSGGIQEEAPALGTPVLVTRAATERPEAAAAGCAWLVGTQTEALVSAATVLLDDPRTHAAMAQVQTPFGDGRAAAAIARWLTGTRSRSHLSR